jgi:hypothetical protein
MNKATDPQPLLNELNAFLSGDRNRLFSDIEGLLLLVREHLMDEVSPPPDQLAKKLYDTTQQAAELSRKMHDTAQLITNTVEEWNYDEISTKMAAQHLDEYFAQYMDLEETMRHVHDRQERLEKIEHP